MRVSIRKPTAGSSSTPPPKNVAKILSSTDRSDTAALSDMGDDEVFEMSVGNSIAPSITTKKKDSRRAKSNAHERRKKVSRSLEKSGKSMRYMAQAIKRSINRSNQSSGSFSSSGNYAITLPSGVTKDVRGSALAVLMAMSMRDLYTHMTEEDVEQLRKEDTSEDAANAVVEMIEAKTEDGGSKLVPKYKKGTSVLYRSPQGIIGVLILDVHFDDLLEPYYTIKLPDGREKQTDNAHIMLPETKTVVANDKQGSVNKETVNRKEVTNKRNRPVRTNESKARSKGKSSSSSKKTDKRKVNNTSKIPPGQSLSKEKEKSKNRDTSTADDGKSEWARRRQGKRNSLKRLAKKFR